VKLSYAFIVALVVLLLLISVPLLNTTKEDFSTYNTAWNGASDAKALASREGYTARPVFALSKIGTSGNGVLFMINPNRSVDFAGSDASALQSFIKNGGILVLANDFGNGDAVLNGLGVSGAARFNGSLLADNVSKVVDAEHPLITDVTTAGLTAGVHELYFNYGTALDTSGRNVTVLARSAPTSYLSTAGTSATTEATAGARPVLATLNYGNGRIVLLSDPSVFINEMLGHADNQQLLTSMLANLTGGNKAVSIMFDESHRAAPPVWSLLYDRINADDTIKYSVVILFIAAFVIGINANALAKRRKRKDMGPTPDELPMNEEAVITDIVRTHPEWRRSRVKGFLKQLQQRRRKRRGN
jgi:hypothetical protein